MKARAPDLKLIQGGLFDFDPPEKTYDWVFLSRALNELLQDEDAYVKAMLPRFMLRAEKDWLSICWVLNTPAGRTSYIRWRRISLKR